MALLSAAALLTACGSNEPAATATATTATTTQSPTTTRSPMTDPTTEPTRSSRTQLSEPNSPAPGGRPPQQTATGGAAPTRTSGGGAQAPAGGELPKDGGDYGDELISAWRAGDSTAVAALTSSSAAAALGRAKPPADLLLVACEDNLCSWSSESGKRLTLTFDAAKLAQGATHAVTSAKVS